MIPENDKVVLFVVDADADVMLVYEEELKKILKVPIEVEWRHPVGMGAEISFSEEKKPTRDDVMKAIGRLLKWEDDSGLKILGINFINL